MSDLELLLGSWGSPGARPSDPVDHHRGKCATNGLVWVSKPHIFSSLWHKNDQTLRAISICCVELLGPYNDYQAHLLRPHLRDPRARVQVVGFYSDYTKPYLGHWLCVSWRGGWYSSSDICKGTIATSNEITNARVRDDGAPYVPSRPSPHTHKLPHLSFTPTFPFVPPLFQMTVSLSLSLSFSLLFLSCCRRFRLITHSSQALRAVTR